MSPNAETQSYDLELILLTRRLAAMAESGVPLSAILDTLQEEAPAHYADALREISVQVWANQSLYQGLAAYPALFPSVYCVMVRAAEVGGMLDTTLHALADLLETDWKLTHLAGRPSLLTQVDHENTPDFSLLTAAQRAVILSLFCRTFGQLLSSGVPILQAMKVTADLLPVDARTEWLEIRRRFSVGASLGEVGFLPPFLRRLVEIAERDGTLDSVMLTAADTYAREVTCRR
ncbi:MAG TPA: type II secretion system F family protein, partial [Armatimonadota bacterium]